MKALYLLYGVTGLVAIVTGLLCWKWHSKYPDTSLGYHVGKAMKSREAWDNANKIAGKLCVFGGLIGFVVLPLVLALFQMSVSAMLILYFFVAVIFLLLVVIVPALLVKRVRTDKSR